MTHMDIRDMGLDLFRKHIMGAEDVRKKTLEGCLLMIEKERFVKIVVALNVICVQGIIRIEWLKESPSCA